MSKPNIAQTHITNCISNNSYEFIKELELSRVKFIDGLNHFKNMVNYAIALSIHHLPYDP